VTCHEISPNSLSCSVTLGPYRDVFNITRRVAHRRPLANTLQLLSILRPATIEHGRQAARSVVAGDMLSEMDARRRRQRPNPLKAYSATSGRGGLPDPAW
jgi:hypothetical protein